MVSVAQVVPEGLRKYHVLLGYVGHIFLKEQFVRRNWVAIDQDLSMAGHVESGEDVQEGGLTNTTWPHEGNELPGLYFPIDRWEHL